MRKMEDIILSHAQMKRMVELTEGYQRKDWSFFVNAQRLVYLTVYNIVYNIDVDGGFIARRKSDGSRLDGMENVFRVV